MNNKKLEKEKFWGLDLKLKKQTILVQNKKKKNR